MKTIHFCSGLPRSGSTLLMNIIQQNPEIYEHDHAYFNERTNHNIRSQIFKWREPERKLSSEFHRQIVENFEWFYEAFYPEHLN